MSLWLVEPSQCTSSTQQQNSCGPIISCCAHLSQGWPKSGWGIHLFDTYFNVTSHLASCKLLWEGGGRGGRVTPIKTAHTIVTDQKLCISTEQYIDTFQARSAFHKDDVTCHCKCPFYVVATPPWDTSTTRLKLLSSNIHDVPFWRRYSCTSTAYLVWSKNPTYPACQQTCRFVINSHLWPREMVRVGSSGMKYHEKSR